MQRGPRNSSGFMPPRITHLPKLSREIYYSSVLGTFRSFCTLDYLSVRGGRSFSGAHPLKDVPKDEAKTGLRMATKKRERDKESWTGVSMSVAEIEVTNWSCSVAWKHCWDTTYIRRFDMGINALRIPTILKKNFKVYFLVASVKTLQNRLRNVIIFSNLKRKSL